MLKTLTLAVAVAIGLGVATGAAVTAQDKLTTADFAGTWNIEAMSHQIALVIEPTDPTHVAATMMMMGRDVPLKGELVGRTISLVGVRDPGAPAPTPAEAAHGVAPAGAGQAAKPIVITLLEDGTLSGEMMTNMGPAKWTGEKLKTKKKG
ncbi:MAG TPA: hypothetical protein VF491_22160 [Vicinamibacterales bacterium]|jgi:hypothetical protein